MMFGFLLRRILARIDMPESHRAYMASFYRASPKAIRKMAGLHKLANHREVVPVEARFAAILVGELAEDCGPCVQIAVDQAREVGLLLRFCSKKQNRDDDGPEVGVQGKHDTRVP